MNPLKIIWNITNKCGYDCEICATYSKRNELNFVDKNKVLNSILTVGIQNIKELDFAGGDPLFVSDSIRIIHDAINVLGKKKISVTTTGKGISHALKLGENLSELLHNCEITIDCQNNIQNDLRNDISYVISNQELIQCTSKNISNLTINVPILNVEADDNSIQRLVDSIAKIDVNCVSVNLIRLMNVGRMGLHPYSSSYSPENFVKTFIQFAKNTCIKNVHVHCALRGKIFGTQCNMLNDKIGVDCSGNVFACAWGGYISDYDQNNICENPFYIGNLLDESLLEILKNDRAVQLAQLIKNRPTKHCRIYCFDNNDNSSIFYDTDPLFKRNI